MKMGLGTLWSSEWRTCFLSWLSLICDWWEQILLWDSFLLSDSIAHGNVAWADMNKQTNKRVLLQVWTSALLQRSTTGSTPLLWKVEIRTRVHVSYSESSVSCSCKASPYHHTTSTVFDCDVCLVKCRVRLTLNVTGISHQLPKRICVFLIFLQLFYWMVLFFNPKLYGGLI